MRAVSVFFAKELLPRPTEVSPFIDHHRDPFGALLLTSGNALSGLDAASFVDR